MVAQYLVADVGGTNTRVALASDGKLQIESIKSYRNSDQSGVDTILPVSYTHLTLPTIYSV